MTMTPRAHGVLTLGLLLLAFLTGLVGVALVAPLPAILYGALIAAGLPLLVFLFGGKCLCRGKRCVMVYPGRLSLHMPDRPSATYTRTGFTGILGTLVVLSVFPLYWLWQTKGLLILFAVLGMAAHAEIVMVVCRACENCRCPVNRWFRARGLAAR